MANEDIRKHGAVTEYRPEKDDVSGGSDKSVQTEAIGAEGDRNLTSTSATSGGAGGQISNLESDQSPPRGKR